MVETGNKFHDKVSRLINWGHWFSFFNLLIISVIGLRYVKYAGLPDTGVGIAYQFISLIGHFSFLSAVFFGLIVFPLAFVIPNQRLYRLFICVISSVAIAFLVFDTEIFRLYNFHINPLIWSFLRQPEQVEKIYSINFHYILIPIVFIVELLLSLFIWKKWRFVQKKVLTKPIVIFLTTTFIATHLIFIWADASQYRPITQQKSIYPLSYPMTARSFLKKQGWLSDNKLLENINKQEANKTIALNYPLTPLTYQQTGAEKNILMITVDALRADMLNENNMPFLFSLSQQGITYKNHYSSANNRPLGLFGLFYGLPNSYWFEVTLNYIPPVLLSRLATENYQFGLFSSIGFLHPEFLQSSFSQIKTTELTRYSAINNNPTTTKKWEKWFSEEKSTNKWFSFLHYEESTPLISTSKTPFSLANRAEKLSQYQQQVLNTDKQINEVISTLRNSHQFENTIIIITGTHGASFEKKSSIDSTINNAHVPLVVLWPDEEPRTITRMTSHVDIVPTLMNKLLGTQTSADQYSSGQNLFNNASRRYLLSGDLNKFVIYENNKITQFSNNGQIKSINWQGEALDEDEDITLLIDVLSKLRRFNAH